MAMTSASEEYFERVAGQWDGLRAGYFGEGLREAAFAHAYLRPEMVVADVGTGTGFMAAGLAPLVGRVYALDGSPAMLEAARKNLAAFDNVIYQLADGASLPLDDGSVDAVFANMYLHHCADPAAAIREMVRVLKPGGRLVITDMQPHAHEWMRAEMADEWLGFDPAQIKAWFREAGLVNVLIDGDGQSCCAASTAAPAAKAEIRVFVATGSRRVAGASAAVQANYGALAEGKGCGCSAEAGAAASAGTAGDAPAASDGCGCSASAAAAPAAASGGAASDGCGCSGGAAASSASCCAPANAMEQIELVEGEADLAWITGYSAEQLAAVPAEAANLSLGCGNPTALASLRPGQVVLDIGSGAGLDAFYAARRVGPAGKVIGLDMTPAMIERARRSAQAAGLGQVEFRLGNAEQMPVESGTVDVVLSNCVINLTEDKGQVFEEAYRVLKDGGRLSISDVVSDKPFPASWRSDAAAWAGCVSGALPEGEYLDLVKQAGFSEVEARRSLSGGSVEGVQVYSLSVTARKGRAQATCGCGTATGATPAKDVLSLTPAPARRGGCCG